MGEQVVSNLDIIVGIVSCNAYGHRFKACMETWGKELTTKSPNTKIIRVVADAKQASEFIFDAETNHLSVQCSDGYMGLPHKTFLFYKWIMQFSAATHVFKCDDDTYINTELFKRYDLKNSSYIGFPMPHPRFGVVYASGGAGYFLDRKAMAAVLEDDEVITKNSEDVAIAQALVKKDIFLTKEKLFIPTVTCWTQGEHNIPGTKIPNREYVKDKITIHLHRLPPESMHEVHALLSTKV